MRIKKIQVSAIRLFLPKPMFTAYGSFSYQDLLLLRLVTTEGLVGFGEVPCGGTLNYGGFSVESVGWDVLNNYAKRIVGRDFENPLDNLALLERPISRSQEEREISSKAPLDLALFDLEGKFYSSPVYELLGKETRDQLQVGHIVASETSQEIITEIQEYFRKGSGNFKIKLSGHLSQDKSKIETIRSNFGDKLVLWVDANEQWSSEQTIEWYRSLGSAYIDYLEQPVPGWDVEGLAKVRKEINPTKIIADQSIFSLHDAVKVLQQKAADVLTLKVMRLGISKSMKIANLAASQGIDCKIGAGGEGAIGGAATIHMAKVLPNLADCNELSFPRYLNLAFSGLIPANENGTAWTVKKQSGLGVEPTNELQEKLIGNISE
jgi:L-alanine-DL-glutamate epimerase-like enolase superfamily enzyme